MKPLLNRQDQERQISEMWDAVNATDENNGRQNAIDQALEVEKKIHEKLDNQDKALQLLWDAVHVINPDNPLIAAGIIAANAERLKSILKSYLIPSGI